MSDLPKWTQKEQFTDRNWGVQMDRYHEALRIAWEAMQGDGHMCPEEDHKKGKHWGGCLKDAMRRISELGEK